MASLRRKADTCEDWHITVEIAFQRAIAESQIGGHRGPGDALFHHVKVQPK